MIEYDRNYKELNITCDECESNDIFDGIDFGDCINEAKKNNWIIFKNDDAFGDWMHFCSMDCRNEYMNNIE